MKSKIENAVFSPITITFENEQEVSWLKGLLTCDIIYSAIEEIDTEANTFFDDLYEALALGENISLSKSFSDKLEKVIRWAV